MSPTDINAVQFAELARLSLQIADDAVVADIKCGALHVSSTDLGHWYDVRPMLDERECSLQCVDMATQALQYAVLRGLVQRDPDHVHLVRVKRHRPTTLAGSASLTTGDTDHA